MAKLVVWGGMLLLAFGGMFMGMQALNADQGELVGFAIGEVDDNNEVQIQIIIGRIMTAKDPPFQTVNPNSTTIDWVYWAAEHFKVTDASGNAVTFKKHGFRSKDISEMQFGPGEQIVVAQLQAGQDYDFTYVRNTAQPEKYTTKFKAEPTEFRRRTFDADY